MSDLLQQAHDWAHNRSMTAEKPVTDDEELKSRVADLYAKTIASELVAFHRHRTRWVPVTERMPDPDQSVLCMVKRSFLGSKPDSLEQHAGKVFKGNVWIVGGRFSFDIGEVTHWQELPEGLDR